jgi:hypothetical protein
MATLAGRASSSYRLPSPVRAGSRRSHLEEPWPERPGVAQFLYLSALLYAIAILLFGAPPGGSPEGRAIWGGLNAQLVAPAAPIAIPERMEPLVAAPLQKLERDFRPPRPIVTPQVVVPEKIQPITPPQMKVERMLPSPRIEVVPVPNAPPVAVPAQVQPIAPELPRVERTMVEPPKLVAPIVKPVAPPVKEVAPPPVEMPRIETPLVPAIPSTPALPAMERAPEIAPKVVAPPAPEPVTPPKVETPPKADVPPVTTPPAAPASREELFAPRAPAPAAPPAPRPPAPRERRATDADYDPTKPAIDAEEMRRRAAQMAREGTGQRAVFAFPMPAPPERKSKTEEALEKARKPDCRTAYKDLGLLAAVPLIANEFGEGTCRW